jgi:hypothetical protein
VMLMPFSSFEQVSATFSRSFVKMMYLSVLTASMNSSIQSVYLA